MYTDFNQNYQTVIKNHGMSGASEGQKSFIQIKDLGETSQNQNNSRIPQGYGELLHTPMAVAQALNQGKMINISTIDSSIQQAQVNLNQQLILIKVLENAKTQVLQEEMIRNVAASDAYSLIPKGANIFAPKPMHAKVESGRIGRSRSMYVTNNPLKTEGSSGEKSVVSDKPSEEVSQASRNKEVSEAGANRKRMNVFKCPHKDRKHYAKNMCNNCYHKLGRNK